MRAKQSSIASGMYSRSGVFTPPIPLHAVVPDLPGAAPLRDAASVGLDRRRSRFVPKMAQDEGLLHDARNLMGAIGLYCDLLAMPGVLQSEHRHYVEDLRLLGVRSAALIQRLMENRMQPSPAQCGPQRLGASENWKVLAASSLQLEKARTAEVGPVESSESLPGPVGLRRIVERCSGLLSRVAGGRAIEVTYGAAASVPVPVDEEALERILVNLVRNSAAAIALAERSDGLAGGATRSAAGSKVLEKIADRTADETPGAVRIGVGLLVNRVDDPKPWPLRRVRLTVEDSGCGMTTEQLERILNGDRAPSRGSHGIGFRVVRDLVAASFGDIRVMSAPGIGTRVQIEWPVTATSRDVLDERKIELRGLMAAGRMAAASGLPGPRRKRRGSRTPQRQGAVGAEALPECRPECATGDGRWIEC